MSSHGHVLVARAAGLAAEVSVTACFFCHVDGLAHTAQIWLLSSAADQWNTWNGRELDSTLGRARSLFFKKEMELSLIGLQNAGKTSLVNTIATGAFHEDMIPTVGFNMRKVAKGSVTIKLWDLGGQVSCDSCVAFSRPWVPHVIPASEHWRSLKFSRNTCACTVVAPE